MILVFKTNLSLRLVPEQLTVKLDDLLLPANWNFDLDDCDRILRVEGTEIAPSQIIALLAAEGYLCEELD